MIILRPTNLHWIDFAVDNPTDLCAHGGVDFQVDGKILVEGGDWAVSASSLYLLRTLSASHTKSQPVGEHLFPCCGHAIYEIEGKDEVLIVGCPSAIDFEVVRAGDKVVITGDDGTQYRVDLLEWETAVCGFADTVQAFYASSSPKLPEEDYEARSFQKFQSEWKRRRSLAEKRLR